MFILHPVNEKKQNAMQAVHTADAPAAIGPYAQAIQVGQLLFCSGQTPLDPVTMTVHTTTIEAQTQQVLENLEAVLKAAGASRAQVVKTTVFLKNFADFERMNGVYARFFGEHKPARSTVEVSRLPKDSLVEIECIAALG
jgi:2-iminobutanoate/2-iminopropanoate deaminase